MLLKALIQNEEFILRLTHCNIFLHMKQITLDYISYMKLLFS